MSDAFRAMEDLTRLGMTYKTFDGLLRQASR
jgi:hypothetical protein